MPKSLETLNQEYMQHFMSLVDDDGVELMAWMAKAAIQSGRHTFHIDVYDSNIWPAPFRLKHADDVWQNCYSKYCVSLRKQGYYNRDMMLARASFHFDFTQMKPEPDGLPLMSVPFCGEMRVYEITKRTEISSFYTALEHIKHIARLKSSIDVDLSSEECEQSSYICKPWYPCLPNLEAMCNQFDVLLKPEAGTAHPLDSKKPLRHTCDCCGFPTILNDYDFCDMCDWQDDNYCRGLNDLYCLNEAQENFRLYGCIFAPCDKDDFDLLTSPVKKQARRRLVDAYLALLQSDKQQREFEQLWQRVLDCENRLKL